MAACCSRQIGLHAFSRRANGRVLGVTTDQQDTVSRGRATALAPTPKANLRHVKLVGPGVDDRLPIEKIYGGDDARLSLSVDLRRMEPRSLSEHIYEQETQRHQLSVPFDARDGGWNDNILGFLRPDQAPDSPHASASSRCGRSAMAENARSIPAGVALYARCRSIGSRSFEVGSL